MGADWWSAQTAPVVVDQEVEGDLVTAPVVGDLEVGDLLTAPVVEDLEVEVEVGDLLTALEPCSG